MPLFFILQQWQQWLAWVPGTRNQNWMWQLQARDSMGTVNSGQIPKCGGPGHLFLPDGAAY